MIDFRQVASLVSFIKDCDGINDKQLLAAKVKEHFSLVVDGHKFQPTDMEVKNILDAPKRSSMFLRSSYYIDLSNDLQERVSRVSKEIAIAAFIENVNIKGNVIEYLITSSDDVVKNALIYSLENGTPLPYIKNANDLGDYNVKYGTFDTKTDIKTKVLFLGSNPKALKKNLALINARPRKVLHYQSPQVLFDLNLFNCCS